MISSKKRTKLGTTCQVSMSIDPTFFTNESSFIARHLPSHPRLRVTMCKDACGYMDAALIRKCND